MVDINIVASGVCKNCGHSQTYHEGNDGCTAEDCACESIGSY